MLPSPDDFGEHYFTSGNYHDYLGRADRYVRIAGELADGVKLGFTLDFGCGPGLLLRGFQKIGVQATGYDWSPWAVAYARERGLDVTDCFDLVRLGHWDTMIALDVFEHMPVEAVVDALKKINPQMLAVRIPVTEIDYGPFVFKESRKDPTHITALTRDTWRTIFICLGYREYMKIQKDAIRNSEGVYCAWLRRG
jgi:hypothetical protein